MTDYLVQMFAHEAEVHRGMGYTHGEMQRLVLPALLFQGAHAAVTTIVVAERQPSGAVDPLVWLTKEDGRWTGFKGDSKKLGVSPGLINELPEPIHIPMVLIEEGLAQGRNMRLDVDRMTQARRVALQLLDEARRS